MKALPPDPVPPSFVTPRQRTDGRRLTIRTAAELDLPEISRLDRAVFGKDAYPYFALRQLFDVHGDHLLVVDDGEALRGYILAAMAIRTKCGWAISLGVEEGCRGLGLGRQLMVEAIRRLHADGADEFHLVVEPANSVAIRLYKSLGFTQLGHRKDYYGPGEDRLLMVLPLRATR